MNKPARTKTLGWVAGLVFVSLVCLFLEFDVVAEKEVKMKHEVTRTDAEWRKQLSPEQYRVLRQKGTEAPFSGKYTKHYEKGTYACAGCGTTLFSSDEKYDSGCGWPSFWKEKIQGNVLTEEDRSHGMVRTEILCSKCGGHLGHVFDDGFFVSRGSRDDLVGTGVKFLVKKRAVFFDSRPSPEGQARLVQIDIRALHRFARLV